MKIGLMISGKLGFKLFSDLIRSQNIITVFTDKNSIEIIEFAKKKSIVCLKKTPRKGNASFFIENFSIDLLLSINYLFLVEKDVINWPKIAAINFHGSLLPKYRGRTPHVWAIINNEKMTGVTAHFINHKCDSGDVIKQVKIPISEESTGGDILNIFYEIYPKLVNNVIEMFIDNNVVRVEQNKNESSYFGKRTPKDGKIDWNWNKNRIRNWVRAQAFPYPGAFTFLNNYKIIIDKVEILEFKSKLKIKNGTIIKLNPVKIKVNDGIVKLISIREGKQYLNIKEILN